MLAWVMAAAIAQATPAPSEPLRPGTVVVELSGDDAARDGRDASPGDDPFVAATRTALGNAGFLVMPHGAQSRYVAGIEVSQEQRGSVATNGVESRPSANIGDWGGGVRVTLPSRRTSLQGLIVTRLTIEMRLRGTGQRVWSGSALTTQVSGTKTADPALVGTKLANVLVAQFPVTMPGPISVP